MAALDVLKANMVGTLWEKKLETFLEGDKPGRPGVIEMAASIPNLVKASIDREMLKTNFPPLEVMIDEQADEGMPARHQFHGFGLAKAGLILDNELKGKRILCMDLDYVVLPALYLAMVGHNVMYNGLSEQARCGMALSCIWNNVVVPTVKNRTGKYDVYMTGYNMNRSCSIERAAFLQDKANEGKLVLVMQPDIWLGTNTLGINFPNKELIESGRVHNGWEQYTFKVLPE